jgi:hypothetical protein
MTNDQDVPRMTAPNWTQSGAAAKADGPQWKRASPVDQFLGGSPAAVFMKLLFVSLIVGALMMWLGLRPADLVTGLAGLADRIWALGFDAVREVGGYIVAGAMIVVPVWLILRLLNLRHTAK